MKSQENIEVWETADELLFIRDLGLHANQIRPLEPDATKKEVAVYERQILEQRIQRTTNYINAARLRTDWGDIHMSAVVAFARRMLRWLMSQRGVISCC